MALNEYLLGSSYFRDLYCSFLALGCFSPSAPQSLTFHLLFSVVILPYTFLSPHFCPCRLLLICFGTFRSVLSGVIPSFNYLSFSSNRLEQCFQRRHIHILQLFSFLLLSLSFLFIFHIFSLFFFCSSFYFFFCLCHLQVL